MRVARTRDCRTRWLMMMMMMMMMVMMTMMLINDEYGFGAGFHVRMNSILKIRVLGDVGNLLLDAVELLGDGGDHDDDDEDVPTISEIEF